MQVRSGGRITVSQTITNELLHSVSANSFFIPSCAAVQPSFIGRKAAMQHLCTMK